MPDDQDDVPEALIGRLHVALMVAGRLGERHARRVEQLHRNEQAANEHVAAELRARLDAERAAARSAFLPAQDSSWWSRARPADVGHAYEAASAWRDFDPDAAATLYLMRRRLVEQFNVDPDQLAPDAGALAEALAARAPAPERASDQLEAVAVVGEAHIADAAESVEHARAAIDAAGPDPDTLAAAALAGACQPTPATSALRAPAPASPTSPSQALPAVARQLPALDR